MQEAVHISSPFSEELASSLLEKGIISFDQVTIARKEQSLKGTSFEDCLIRLGFISESAFTQALADVSGVEKIDLKKTLLDPFLKELIPREIAKKFCLIPLSWDSSTLRIAMADIHNFPALDALKKKLPLAQTILSYIAPESDILDSIDDYYGYDLSIQGLLREIELTPSSAFTREDSQNPTIRLVNALLIDAIKKRASDIHFEPEGSFVRIRYRIDGLLSHTCTLHGSFWAAICVRLKVMAKMNIAEARRPQNGRMTFFIGSREVDIRVSAHPTVHGENIVVRILDKSYALLALEELGYSNHVITQIHHFLQQPEGLCIFTGPTGCGKTTSLYSLLSYLNSRELNIMTLEEPVEYKLPFIRQTDIKDYGGGFSFADGVRSILRQDPDVILIGEIRDTPTAQMALRAAMTGHKVFSTLHTNDVFGAIPRLLDLGVSPHLLAGNLSAVVSQRLVRRLCFNCREERQMTPFEAILLECKKPQPLYSPKGCEICQRTGFKGRFALAEVLVFNDNLNELLLTSTPTVSLKKHSLETGFISLAEDGRKRILRGDTTLEEVSRCVNLCAVR